MCLARRSRRATGPGYRDFGMLCLARRSRGTTNRGHRHFGSKSRRRPLEISGAVNTGNNVRRGHWLRLAVGTGRAAKSPHTQNEGWRPAVLGEKRVQGRRGVGSKGYEIAVKGSHLLLLLRLQKPTSLASIMLQSLDVAVPIFREKNCKRFRDKR